MAHLAINTPHEEVFVKKEYRKNLPAITHDDGSARLQTLGEEYKDRLVYSILEFMEEQNTIPELINTAFNLNGEPNVENEVDAIRTFFTSGLDVLAIDNLIIKKQKYNY